MRGYKKTIIFIFIFFSFFGKCLGGDDDSEGLISLLMERASEKNIEGLLELRDQAISSKKTRYAYHLARFIADPQCYAEKFIEEFPSNDVMGLIYKLERSQTKDGLQLTPYFLYSFDQLGRLAAGGNQEAVKKLFNAMIHSDGIVTEYLCELISKVITDQTTIALDALSKLSTNNRKHLYICFGDSASLDDITSMKISLEKELSEKHINIKKEVLDAIDNE